MQDPHEIQPAQLESLTNEGATLEVSVLGDAILADLDEMAELMAEIMVRTDSIRHPQPQ